MSTAVKLQSRDARSIPFQEASLDIWDKKYRLSAKDGTPIAFYSSNTAPDSAELKQAIEAALAK